MEVFIMMNKAEIIKGINTTIEGLMTIRDALADVDSDATKSKSVAKREQVQKEAVDEAPVMTGKLDVEQLKSMKYNEFKKLAASLGVKCTGTRDEIMERILALDVEVDESDEEVDAEEAEEKSAKKDKKESKSDKSAKGKKLGKKEADEPSRDEFDEQAEEIAKDTSVEDIIESLADVDIKATKKNAVEKLAYALREGLIELDDEDEEDEEDDDVTESEADEDDEITAESYFPEFDPEGFNDPESKDMTEERSEAITEKMDEILTEISEGTLEIKEIESYLEDNCTEEELELLGEDYEENDLIKMYMEMIKRTIDNEGEEVEPSDPYEVGKHDMCCGHELKYVKKTKKYVCSHCGNEYEAE